MLPLKFPLFPHFASAPYSVFSLCCFTFFFFVCECLISFLRSSPLYWFLNWMLTWVCLIFFIFCVVFLNGCLIFVLFFLMWFWVPINYTILCEILLNVEDSGASICFRIWVLFGWENVGKEKGMTVLKGLDFFLLSILYFCLHHMGLHLTKTSLYWTLKHCNLHLFLQVFFFYDLFLHVWFVWLRICREINC